MQPTPHNSQEQRLEAILLEIFGVDSWDDSALHTAQRVIKYWRSVLPEDDIDFEFTTFPAEQRQMIVVANIEFASLCAHHLLPFTGRAHVAYIPHEVQVGLSKIPRLVDYWANRPQVQERLTAQIVWDLNRRLSPNGVMVVVQAQHTCMCARGTRKHNGFMTTSLPKGIFLSNPAARDEFFQLIREH